MTENNDIKVETNEIKDKSENDKKEMSLNFDDENLSSMLNIVNGVLSNSDPKLENKIEKSFNNVFDNLRVSQILIKIGSGIAKKRVDPENQDEFVAKYTMYLTPILKYLKFDEAFDQLKVVDLTPTQRLILGIVSIAAFTVLLPLFE